MNEQPNIPDMIAQAGELLRRYTDCTAICTGAAPDDAATVDSALTRIAIALEHIAERLDEVSARGKLLDFPPKPKPAERPAPDTTLG